MLSQRHFRKNSVAPHRPIAYDPVIVPKKEGGQRMLRIVLVMICIASCSLPMLAHHSLAAEFDLHRSLKVTGIVTKVDWANPHALFFVDSRSAANGKIVNWVLQLPNPTMVARLGWPRDPFKAGIVVTVTGHPAKDGSNKVTVQDVTSSDG